MTKLRQILLPLLLTFLPFPALSQSGPVVVELFTSQGCSSCPPADALMEELAQRDDVIPLALHVDYWDYIGWADTFAQAKFTERQKGYASANGRRMIYTPQMVVNGLHDVVGAKAMKLADLIMQHKMAPQQAQVSAARDGAELSVSIRPTNGALTEPVDIFLVRYMPQANVAIERGENAGRTITYINTVHDWSQLGQWNGQGAADLTAPIDGDLPAVVLLQTPQFGSILAAARVEAQ